LAEPGPPRDDAQLAHSDDAEVAISFAEPGAISEGEPLTERRDPVGLRELLEEVAVGGAGLGCVEADEILVLDACRRHPGGALLVDHGRRERHGLLLLDGKPLATTCTYLSYDSV
jgi:hypothetical protein